MRHGITHKSWWWRTSMWSIEKSRDSFGQPNEMIAGNSHESNGLHIPAMTSHEFCITDKTIRQAEQMQTPSATTIPQSYRTKLFDIQCVCEACVREWVNNKTHPKWTTDSTVQIGKLFRFQGFSNNLQGNLKWKW